MTGRVGSISARQIAATQLKLSEAVRDALWNHRMSHGREDPHIVSRDRDRLLEAAQELLGVLDEYLRPQCPAIMPGTTAWRCFKPEGHAGSLHGDGVVSWSD